jgi:UTP--glucose-1-phosphate uridylyltransferase
VVPNPERQLGTLVVELDPAYYQFIGQYNERFPEGPPSLLHCCRLRVEGDHLFLGGVQVWGDVVLRNESGQQVVIAAGTMPND